MKNKTRNQELVRVKFISHQKGGVVIFEILKESFMGEAHAGLVNVVIESVSETEGLKLVVLDLKKVRKIDSFGIGIFILIYGELKNKKIELRVAGCYQEVKKLLKRTKLDKVFGCHELVVRAVQEFFAQEMEAKKC